MAAAMRPREMHHSCELGRRLATPMTPQTRKLDQTKARAFSPKSNIGRMADVLFPDVPGDEFTDAGGARAVVVE